MNLDKLANAIEGGRRLSQEEALFLYTNAPLRELGELANTVNVRKNADKVYYNLNRHINPTNVCAMSCKFCSFSRKPGDEGAYEFSIEEMVDRANAVYVKGAREVHMVGGLHPRWSFQVYLDMIDAIKSRFPDMHIKAFTAVEIDWLARKARLDIKSCLQKLKEAGLDSMPGGGAEIFHPEIREQICDTKTDADKWISIHREAHNLGLKSNCTMLYGHIEQPWHRIDHMQRLRDLQDETGGFNVFIPLAFQPHENELGKSTYTRGEDDLRTIAIARLFLDNFKHIKSYWIMMGQEISQVALHFGANDLDGTVTEEKISRMAGGRSGMGMSKTDLQQLIIRAGKTPVERDSLYNEIRQEESSAHSVWNQSLCSLKGLISTPLELSSAEPRDDATLDCDLNTFTTDQGFDWDAFIEFVQTESFFTTTPAGGLHLKTPSPESKLLTACELLKALQIIKTHHPLISLSMNFSDIPTMRSRKTPSGDSLTPTQDPAFKLVSVLGSLYLDQLAIGDLPLEIFGEEVTPTAADKVSFGITTSQGSEAQSSTL